MTNRHRTVGVSDLDRCQHGRHSNDVCFSCQASGDHEIDNYGNPFLTQVVGFNLAGQTITVQDLLDAEKDKR